MYKQEIPQSKSLSPKNYEHLHNPTIKRAQPSSVNKHFADNQRTEQDDRPKYFNVREHPFKPEQMGFDMSCQYTGSAKSFTSPMNKSLGFNDRHENHFHKSKMSSREMEGRMADYRMKNSGENRSLGYNNYNHNKSFVREPSKSKMSSREMEDRMNKQYSMRSLENDMHSTSLNRKSTYNPFNENSMDW
jgi:hypothetical protein